MDTALQRHALTLQSGTAAATDASAWARLLTGRLGWDEARIYALDLCIVELVSNVVDHAYRGGAGDIRVDLELGEAQAVLTVRDYGPPFDPLSAPAPPMPVDLERASLGGYGVQMVRAMAERCRYERRDGANIFTVYLSSAGKAPPTARHPPGC